MQQIRPSLKKVVITALEIYLLLFRDLVDPIE